MVVIDGWFESERGAVLFQASGAGLYEAAMQMVKRFGGDAVGVDREAEIGTAFPGDSEAGFWRFYDQIVAQRKGG